MGRKRTPGLYKRREVWHIDKHVFGRRLCESTGTDSLEEAEKYLAKRAEEIRHAAIYGVRPKRIFREAATKYLLENQQKASIRSDANQLKVLDKYIGDMTMEAIHMATLQRFIEGRIKEKVSFRTINHGLKVVRRILNLAANEWLDEFSLSWLLSAPKIKLLAEPDLRKPHPLNWEEQEQFFKNLPSHLRQMALFAVNTGCRDGEVCSLRWEWEVKVPGMMGTCVFIIPSEHVKNREDRLVVLNHTARVVIEEVRNQHSIFVFTYKGNPITRMTNTAWKRARRLTNIDIRVHDLKHTFGRRLRAAGVSFEDRQDLLGHRSGRITTHYSAAELSKLIEAANSICMDKKTGPTLTVLRNVLGASSRKNPARAFGEFSKISVSC